MIACVRVPFFAAAVERLHNPHLEGAPLVIGDPPQAPQHVFAVSHEAAEAGIAPGMAVREAQALCPDLRVIPASHTRYRRALGAVLETLAIFSPFVEPEHGLTPHAGARRRKTLYHLPASQVDGESSAACYLDLGRLHGDDAPDLAFQVRDLLYDRTRLTPALGLAGGRFPARVAAESLEPEEVLIVMPGFERVFLAGYPGTTLPIDGETIRQLHLLGLESLGQVAALPAAALLDRFGPVGRDLHRLASGHDASRVAAYVPDPALHQARPFDGPVRDRPVLEAALETLAGALAARLLKQSQAARAVTLALALDDGGVLETSLTLRQPTASAGHLARTLTELLAGLRVTCGVVEVAVTLEGVAPVAARQLSLFARGPTSQERLRAVLKDLAARYGDDGFYWASLTDPNALLLERRFQLKKAGES